VALVQLRPFRNVDAPLLADVWRSQPGQRGLAQPITAATIEELVLSKNVFEREGLILAVDGGQPLGFVHAGFGPRDDLAGGSTQTGIISMLMLRSPELHNSLATELLARGESYLRGRGARTFWAGGVERRDPFYLGLYGGSEMCGILNSDARSQQLYASHGYEEAGRTLVLQRELSRFRPVVDRTQMQVRRRMCVQTTPDPPAKNWWDASTLGSFERVRWELQARDARAPSAGVTFWQMQPLSASWGVRAAGLVDLDVLPAERRQGLATFLLGEAFRQLAAQGISLVEAQVDASDAPAYRLFCKLGFEAVDEAVRYRKAGETASQHTY
jgi:ribosomal protein S18 acetylase RimI-like enzyme